MNENDMSFAFRWFSSRSKDASIWDGILMSQPPLNVCTLYLADPLHPPLSLGILYQDIARLPGIKSHVIDRVCMFHQ